MSLRLSNHLEVWVTDFYATDSPPKGIFTLLIIRSSEVRRRAAIIWAMLKEPEPLTTPIPTPDLSFLDAVVETK